MSDGPHILVVDDHREIRDLVSRALLKDGFRATAVGDGKAMRRALADAHIDLILLDLMLPGEDGLSLCRALRAESDIPIIMLTAKGDEIDRVVGLELGADDYLPKPFSMAELQVRIEAILRRVALERRHQGPLEQAGCGELQFDEGLCDVRLNSRLAGLTPSEYRLLDILNRNLDEVLSKPFLYQHVLQRGYSRHDRSLDMHVSQIRRKLKGIGYHERQIRTVWGKGYVLSASEAE